MDRDPSYPFGELLKAFRRDKRLTQQQLATKLGVHRNTISGWERGDFLPENRGMVLELAKHLRLDDQETRQLLEASLTAFAPYWGAPVLRNPFFTGREEVLDALHTRLCTEQAVALTQSYALHGLGGIGKTQLAVEYAYRYALEYRAVFWIGAESVETIMASYLAVAELLKLPEYQEADQQRAVTAVHRWLTTHNGWLLIWDNLEEPELLQRFLPPARQGAVLITTRRQALGPLAQGLELPPMKSEEGVQLLLRRAKVLASEVLLNQHALRRPAEYDAAQELVAMMGGLPLALDQAGAYIEETGCSLFDYVQRYKQQRAHLLNRRGTAVGDHPQSVTATFLLARQHVASDHPMADELLSVCAFLHAESIPEELFAVDSPLAAGPAPLFTDAYHLDLSIAALRTLSLLQRNTEARTLSIHRLVQAVLQEAMSEQERAEFQQRAMHLLYTHFPEVTHETWEQCERLLPHVLVCAAGISDQVYDQDLADVLKKAADYLRERGQYEQARPLYERTLHIREKTVGLEHPLVADVLNSLANLSAEQGKYEQAELLYERALRIWEQTLGPEHPEVAYMLNRLGVIYMDQGKYEQARLLNESALRIWEQTLGPEHPRVTYPLNSLANLYVEQGKYEQARPLYERALRIREQALGAEHPRVATLLHGLAALSCRQGRYEEAESLYHRALVIREQHLGQHHPETARTLLGLANLYVLQSKEQHAEADLLSQRTLAMRERRVGREYPENAQTLVDLVAFRSPRGRLSEACSLYQRALSIQTHVFGADHPNTQATRARYAQVLQQMAQHQHNNACTVLEERYGEGDETKDVEKSAELYGDIRSVLPSCPHCQRNSAVVKSGTNRSGSLRFRCQRCQRYFTPQTAPHGYDSTWKGQALLLAEQGKSYRFIARQLGVNHRTVRVWIKAQREE